MPKVGVSVAPLETVVAANVAVGFPGGSVDVAGVVVRLAAGVTLGARTITSVGEGGGGVSVFETGAIVGVEGGGGVCVAGSLVG